MICWWYVLKWMKVLQAPVRMKMGTHTLLFKHIYICVCACAQMPGNTIQNGSKLHILYSIHKCNLREWKQMKMVPEILPNFSSTNGLISTIYVYTYVQYTRYVFKNTHILHALYLHFLIHAFIYSYLDLLIRSYIHVLTLIHLLIYSYVFICWFTHTCSLVPLCLRFITYCLYNIYICASHDKRTPRGRQATQGMTVAQRGDRVPSDPRWQALETMVFPHQTKGGSCINRLLKPWSVLSTVITT